MAASSAGWKFPTNGAGSPTAAKPLPHPLRAQVRSDAELQYISNLGNADDSGVTMSMHQQSSGQHAKSLSQQKRMASSMRDEKGERISQDQQAAIVKALQALESNQDAAFEQREAISEKIAVVVRKLAETNDKLTSIEQENEGVEQHVAQLKSEIATIREEREQNLKELECMRAENEEIKSRTLMACDMRIQKLRQDIRDTERMLKTAIWSSGGMSGSMTSGVGAEAPLPPLPPVEPIILAPVRQGTLTGAAGVATPSKSGQDNAARGRASDSFNIRKYSLIVDSAIKDVAEIRRRKVFIPSRQLLAKLHTNNAKRNNHATPLDLLNQLLQIPGSRLPRPKTSSHIRTLGHCGSRSTPALRMRSVPSIRSTVTSHEVPRARPQTTQPRRRRIAGVVTVRPCERNLNS